MFLNQPFPTFGPSWRGVFSCLIAGFSVWFVLFVIQPFGMTKHPTLLRAEIAAVYGMVTFIISLFFTNLLPLLLPTVFDEKKWTVGKEMATFFLVILFIAAGNFLAGNWIYGARLVLANFFDALADTFSIAFIPVVLSVLIKLAYLNKKYQSASVELNASLQLHAKEGTHPSAGHKSEINAPLATTRISESVLLLSGDNQDERLELQSERLLAMSAANNYVKIYFYKDESLQTCLFRTTLRNMEQQTSGHPSFLRCHRSYLVNLDHVLSITGNAQGYRLHLLHLDEAIPVGRQYNQVIRERLAHL